jgi:hypothetical protein
LLQVLSRNNALGEAMGDEHINGRRLPPDMLEGIKVRAVRPFWLGARQVTVGDTLTMPKHRAEYLRFLQLVEWLT